MNVDLESSCVVACIALVASGVDVTSPMVVGVVALVCCSVVAGGRRVVNGDNALDDITVSVCDIAIVELLKVGVEVATAS